MLFPYSIVHRFGLAVKEKYGTPPSRKSAVKQRTVLFSVPLLIRETGGRKLKDRPLFSKLRIASRSQYSVFHLFRP